MLYWNTVNDLLRESLEIFMKEQLFSDFRLVGGTALSLHLGHRMSVDIDLFTDATYESVDFEEIERFLIKTFPCVQGDFGGLPGFGKSYLVGESATEHVKLDIYYSLESFICPIVTTDGTRLASIDDIVAMKVDVISRGGRKKDFWDLHELMDKYDLAKMLELHEKRHPYAHNRKAIIRNFTDFTSADEDFNPICLHGKHWDFIKDDFLQFVQNKKHNI